MIPDRGGSINDWQADRKPDYNYGFCAGKEGGRTERFRNPRFKRGIIPAISRGKPHEGDVHAAAFPEDLTPEDCAHGSTVAWVRIRGCPQAGVIMGNIPGNRTIFPGDIFNMRYTD
jgi:hypothetical protein